MPRSSETDSPTSPPVWGTVPPAIAVPERDRRQAPWWPEILGGGTGSVVMLAVVLTLGVLAFAPLGGPAVHRGLVASFVSVTLGGLMFAALGRSALPVAGPSSATALIFAALAATLVRQVPGALEASSAALNLTVLLAALSIAVVLMGLLMMAFAALGLGRLALFVPQPVLAGFMNGVAVLILLAQLPALLGVPGSVAQLGLTRALAAIQPATLVIGLATAAITWLVAWRAPRAPAQLIGLGMGVLLHTTVHALWPSVPLGPLIGAFPSLMPLPELPLQIMAPGAAGFLQQHARDVLTTALILAVIGSLESVLALMALGQQLNTRCDPGRELMALGLANVVVGIFGGLPTVILRARALATLQAGGQGRRAALAGAAFFGVMYALLGPVIAKLPEVVLAGIMVTVAVSLGDRWTHQLLTQWRSGERSTDAWQSLAIVALVCGVTLWQGFAVGVATGVAVALVVFVRSMNRSLLRSRCSAVEVPSKRIYPENLEAYLQTARSRITVLELEGALFFGSVERLAREAEAVPSETRSLVLDLRGVSTIDASGAMLLEQLGGRLQRRGIAVLLAGVATDNAHGRRLRAFGCFRGVQRADWFADTDRAVEAAEQSLLQEAGLAPGQASIPVRSCTLFRGLQTPQSALVTGQLLRRQLGAGDTLFRQGDAASSLYVLTRGSISIVAGTGPEHARQRFLSFSAGLMLGETAMLDGGGRSATATADTDVELYELTQAGLDVIAAQDPALAVLLYRNMAVHLSERLRRATAVRSAAPA